LLCVSLKSVNAISQAAPPPTNPVAYTPPPVSTTYRPLIGKLFFSDAERDRLDKARKDGVSVVDSDIVARSPQVDGFVNSSSGRTTYWVDGGQRIDAKPRDDLAATPKMVGPESRVKFLESGRDSIAPAMSNAVTAKTKEPTQSTRAAPKRP
jgi:hypothetical protein